MAVEVHVAPKFEALCVVEKKGLGHPDTLADLLADTFSWEYSQYGMERFGAVLNHNLDKVVLSGGTASIGFGVGKQLTPIECVVYGKAVEYVGGERIPLAKLFSLAAEKVFDFVFGGGTFSSQGIKTRVALNSGIGAEHPGGYYAPSSRSDLIALGENLTLTDTAITASFYPNSIEEDLCVKIEAFVNGQAFKQKYPETGWDVKILLRRSAEKYHITLCVPCIAHKTASEARYREIIEAIRAEVESFCMSFGVKFLELSINTKDTPGHGYLTLFGSALDKGDIGVVGRGNKACGFISVLRPNIVESIPGKNPVRSTGVVCQTLSDSISKALFERFNLINTVLVAGNNGARIDDVNVVILLDPDAKIRFDEINAEVAWGIENLRQLLSDRLSSSPLARLAGIYGVS